MRDFFPILKCFNLFSSLLPHSPINMDIESIWINLFSSQPIKWNSIVESSHALKTLFFKGDGEHLIKIEYWLNYLSFQLCPLDFDSFVHWRIQLLMLMNHAKVNKPNTTMKTRRSQIIFFFGKLIKFFLLKYNENSRQNEGTNTWHDGLSCFFFHSSNFQHYPFSRSNVLLLFHEASYKGTGA